MDDDLDSMFTEGVPEAEQVVDTPPEPPKEPEAPAEEPPKEPEAPPPAEPETPAEPPAEEKPTEPEEPKVEESKPLTAEDVRSIISDLRTQERTATKTVDEMETTVLNAYYPNGLSNVLVDEKSGREIRTPQDVVELSGDTMTIEEASQWLINEQYKLDQQINTIKSSARELAEVNANFRDGATRILENPVYKQIFEKYPTLQNKIYKNYMKTVRMDNEKELVLSAPDIEEYYADVMEPYVMAFNYKPQAPPQTPPATPGVPVSPKIPESRQTAADRMDVSGDGGGGDTEVDPNDVDANLNKVFGE